MLKRTLVVGSALVAVVFATATLRPTEAAAAPKRNTVFSSFSSSVGVGGADMDSQRGAQIKATTQPRQLPAVQKIRTRYILEPPGAEPYSSSRHTLFVRDHQRLSPANAAHPQLTAMLPQSAAPRR